jgi:tight adherence protein C
LVDAAEGDVIVALAVTGAWWLAARLGWRRPWLGGAVGGLLVLVPLVGVAVAAIAVAQHRWARARRVGDLEVLADADVGLLADLLGLGLTAGLSLRAAIDVASPQVAAPLQVDLADLRRRVDRGGLAAGLGGTRGRLEELARVAAGAAVSGAPLAAAIAAYSKTRRHADHAARMERARRLPVRLLLPLALLILPGFVLLAVGPAVLQGLARLGPIQ